MDARVKPAHDECSCRSRSYAASTSTSSESSSAVIFSFVSSVIVVGALLAVGVALAGDDTGPVWARALGFVALVFASVNIFGGFLVTQRMLAMYQKKKK